MLMLTLLTGLAARLAPGCWSPTCNTQTRNRNRLRLLSGDIAVACWRKDPRTKAALLAQAGLISDSPAGSCLLHCGCCCLEYSLSHQP